jgi:hypothetical protein
MAKKAETEQQKRAKAKSKAAEKLAKDVKAALEEAGYEFPSFPDYEYRQEFVQKHGYDPGAVLVAAVQAAELDEGWRKRIVPLAAKE